VSRENSESSVVNSETDDIFGADGLIPIKFDLENVRAKYVLHRVYLNKNRIGL
jgi:hypothetical protein